MRIVERRETQYHFRGLGTLFDAGFPQSSGLGWLGRGSCNLGVGRLRWGRGLALDELVYRPARGRGSVWRTRGARRGWGTGCIHWASGCVVRPEREVGWSAPKKVCSAKARDRKESTASEEREDTRKPSIACRTSDMPSCTRSETVGPLSMCASVSAGLASVGAESWSSLHAAAGGGRGLVGETDTLVVACRSWEAV
jgi:hypothetical protein